MKLTFDVIQLLIVEHEYIKRLLHAQSLNICHVQKTEMSWKWILLVVEQEFQASAMWHTTPTLWGYLKAADTQEVVPRVISLKDTDLPNLFLDMIFVDSSSTWIC
jgi:hypothetical protein